MKLDVGMYIRTYEGISKIVNIINNVCGETFIITDNKLGNIHYLDSIGYIIDLKEEKWIEKHIKEKLIDLIQVGDYVNGYEVEFIDKENKIIICYTATFEEEEVKTIVTKEQFEEMSYEVKE